MIDLISAFLFGIAANIDNIAIGFSYGIKNVHISTLKNFFICLCTTFVTFLSLSIGTSINLFLPEGISEILGSLLLIGIGVFFIIKEVLTLRYHKDRQDVLKKSKKENLTYQELLLLIVTLSSNNIATGIAASITGVHILYTIIFTFLFSFIFMLLGNKIGSKFFNNKLELISNIFSNLILIILGILQLF